MLLRALATATLLSMCCHAIAADKTTSRFVKPWNLTVAITERAPDGSDYFLYSFKLTSRDGKVVGASDWGYGSFLISPPNKQIVSCEGGGVDQGAAVKFYDLRATVVRTLKHEGTLKDCGTTKDQLLYWLHYSDYENPTAALTPGAKAVSLIRVVDSNGVEIHRATLRTAGRVTFKHRSSTYELSFDEPTDPY